MSRLMNFNPGPATLPLPALERAQAELVDWDGTGMSVLEHSHRGGPYERLQQATNDLVREVGAVPATHEILFLQGGASQQFAQIPLNFLRSGKTGAYVVSGVWGEKAVSEAKATAALTGGEVVVAATSGEGDGKEKQYRRAPDPKKISTPANAAYLHFTSNETIHGVEYEAPGGVAYPSSTAPLVCDMSSDFLWKPTDFSRFDLVYAGAQKNVGPSGLVVVIIRRELLAAGRADIPKIFSFKAQADAGSMLNTPPTFSVYLLNEVLSWTKREGGTAGMERRNREKAALIYGVIDGAPEFYNCPVDRPFRSVMNVVFRLPNEALEDRFVAEAKAAGMVGVKGHRSVGGMRISLYNAVPVEWARALEQFMKEFARRNG